MVAALLDGVRQGGLDLLPWSEAAQSLRMRADFAGAGADDDLTLAESAAWDTYCAGRLARAGIEINTQRWRYNHRNRFGFSNAGDADFERLWAADELSWSEVVAGIADI